MFSKKHKIRMIAEICDDFQCTVIDTASYTTYITNFKNGVCINAGAKLLTEFSISSHTITVLKVVILHNPFLLLKYVKFSIDRFLIHGLGACQYPEQSFKIDFLIPYRCFFHSKTKQKK